jgi:hypothetical protein
MKVQNAICFDSLYHLHLNLLLKLTLKFMILTKFGNACLSFTEVAKFFKFTIMDLNLPHVAIKIAKIFSKLKICMV